MRTPLPKVLAIGCIAVLLAGTACSRRSKAPNFARVDEEAIAAARAPVNILDRDLRNAVAGDMATMGRLPDGRLRARVNLRNSTRKDLNVVVRTVFKDEGGFSTGDETAWQPMFFGPQQIQTYIAESREPGATSYTVEVRRP